MITNIKIQWWDNEGQDEIPEGHQFELREVALGEISDLSKQGFNAHELHHVIEGIHYNGVWDLLEKYKEK